MSIILAIALAPVFIIAFYIYFRDKYEKEPWSLLLISMVLGVIIALPVIFAEQFMSFIGRGLNGVLAGAWRAFMVAAFCEEGFKLLALYLLIWKSAAFNEKFDGIVYATFISLGFAGIENVLYVMDGGISTGLTRAFTAVPAHALFGVSMGFFFGLAKFYPKQRKQHLYLSFLLPFLLHGIYDFILMSGINFLLLLFIPFIIYLWIAGFKKLKALNSSSYYNTDIDIGIDFSKVKEFEKP
ncbi:MAG: PrsW family glutamic-type intramembrane protease [Prolixibacteraceae bacterium]